MITIFTPTYNRGNNLIDLYNSLVAQSINNFEWLIVDDGSTDDTKSIVNSFILENKLRIRYYYQNNQGKYIALNKGIELSEGEFFMCVDSDDYLSKEALFIINRSINELSSNSIGCVFPQSLNYESEKLKWKNLNNNDIDIIDLKEIYGIIESAILIKSSIVKKYRIPEVFDDNGQREKFCSEGILYNHLISEGKFRVVNSVVYISNYLDKGITNNLFSKVWINNFNAVIADLRLRFEVASKYGGIIKVKVRLKAIMNLNAICIKNDKSVFKYTPSCLYSSILYLPSMIFKLYRFSEKSS